MINIKFEEEINKALSNMDFDTLTPIQEQVIPVFKEGADIIAQAPTGTGKTCAFGIPIIENIEVESKDIQALIVCPTRELARQIVDELRKVAFYKEGVRITAVYGGEYFERQLAGLRKKPQIVVGTPGRIIDHLERKTIRLKSVETVVLDEADEMLNMGFRDDMEKIFAYTDEDRQTVLFSATMPKEILQISEQYQKNPVMVKTQLNDNDIPPITQYYAYLDERQKIFLMDTIIKECDYKLMLCFVSMKKRADSLAKVLKSKGYKCECLHGDLRQSKRDQIMRGFKNGEFNMLIATDVVARGIDVKGIDAIFNFDIPYDREYYIHRIGRTARNNATGVAYTFVTGGERNKITEIEKYTQSKMIKLEEFSQDNLRIYMNNKKIEDAFNKLSGNLNGTKTQISKQLEDYNFSNGTNYTVLDIAAALVEADTLGIAIPKARSMEEMDKRAKKASGIRYFVNFGTRDNATKQSVTKFLQDKIGVVGSQIIDITLMDNYGFVELEEGADTKIKNLIGEYFNGREINIEKAGEKKSTSKSYGKSGRNDGKRYDDNKKGRAYGDGNSKSGDYKTKRNPVKSEYKKKGDNGSGGNGKAYAKKSTKKY